MKLIVTLFIFQTVSMSAAHESTFPDIVSFGNKHKMVSWSEFRGARNYTFATDSKLDAITDELQKHLGSSWTKTHNIPIPLPPKHTDLPNTHYSSLWNSKTGLFLFVRQTEVKVLDQKYLVQVTVIQK
jgi:hypothetical protein